MRRVAVAVIVIVVVAGAAFFGGRSSINNRQASSAVTTTTTGSITTTTMASATAKRGPGDVLACTAFDADSDGAYSGVSQAIQQQLIDNELLLAEHATNIMLVGAAQSIQDERASGHPQLAVLADDLAAMDKACTNMGMGPITQPKS